MSKKIDKIILDDFKETYSIEVDKEKIYKQLQVKPVKDNKLLELLKFKKLCKGLSIAVCLLLVSVIVLVIYKFGFSYKSIDDKVLTDDFIEYMEEYSGDDIYKLYGYIDVSTNCKLYIYKMTNAKKEFYFYSVIEKEDEKKFIIIDGKRINLESNSFGLLCEIDITKENKDIIFSIEYNGKVTEYKIG